MDFDVSRRLDVSSDTVWAVVADPTRLPEWLPTVVAARMLSDTPRGSLSVSVELEGSSHGHPYSLTSRWTAAEADHHLEWAGTDGAGYTGSLRVLGGTMGTSEVKLHLTVPNERVADLDAEAEESARGIEDAFDRLSSLLAS